jgi:CheY-like chemotaxis protein
MLIQEMPPEIRTDYRHRALILDDNDANRLLLNFAMQMGNVEHVEAGDGNTALALWESGEFSFAFLDIELPDISGLEVARRIRRLDSGIAIIMCSTNDEPATITRAIHAGCDAFLVKPFQLDVLLSLTRVLNRESLRSMQDVLVIDNTGRNRWESRVS